MTGRIREISLTAPLDPPMGTEALRIERPDAAWRVFVFPGTPCRKELFYRFLRVAPPDMEVVVVSRLGFGKGHRAPVLDFREQARVIEPFLGDGKKVAAVGVSYGGALALTSALEYPEHVRAVVTVAALVTEPFDYARWLADLGGHARVRPFVPNRLHIVRAEVEGRRAQIGDLLDRAREVSTPVEVIHGDFDHLVSLEDAHKLSQHIGAKASFEKIPGGTHYLELQFPRRIFAAVRRAVSRADGAA